MASPLYVPGPFAMIQRVEGRGDRFLTGGPTEWMA